MRGSRGIGERTAARPGMFPAVAFIPLLSFAAAETVTGNLLRITPAALLLNAALYCLLYFGALAVFGSTKYSWPVLSFLIYVLAAAEYFVISFRERPVMIWDVLALRTALTVSANYRYTVTPALAVTFLLTAGAAYLAWRFPIALSFPRGKAAALWAVLCAAFAFLLFGVLSPALDLDVHMWDPIVSFEREGFLLSTVLSLKTPVPVRPEGYSRETAEELYAALEAEYGEQSALSDGADSAPVPVNVICIMNESFSDLRLYDGLSGGSFETDAEYLEYFDSLSANAQRGRLYVPVFGAMTANSEYEFLTGNACAFAPPGCIPFQFYTRPGDDSLARDFKKAGYRTVAMHPYPGYNWNRTKAYENLGFDEFLDLEYYEALGRETALEKPRGYMSDRSDYDGILRLLEEKKPGEKLFVFNVTMQNHGGYEVDGLPPAVHVRKLNGIACEGEYPKADQYLTLMRMSDEALRYLLERLQLLEEPTMVVLFGDHQPSVETPFFEALYGSRWSEVPDRLKLNSFVTPYLIWTNYNRKAEEAEPMSAFMLGNRVLEEAGLPLNGYRIQVKKVCERYQAVHLMGVLDREGNFTGASGMDGELFPELERLHTLQYYRMYEKRQ